MGIRQHVHNQRRIEQHLDTLVDQATDDLRRRFQTYEYGLLGARGAVIGAGGLPITRERFRRYVESSNIDSAFPGARGFGFIVRVPRSRVAALVASARASGHPGFAIRELSRHSGERFVIKYIEPEARNLAAVGLDIASDQDRRNAALLALRTGQPVLTGPITLVQATDRPKRSMLFLLPVYPGSQKQATRTSEGAGIGWVYAPLVIDEVLADFGLVHTDYGFTLTDVTERRSEPLHASPPAPGGVDGRWSRSRTFPIYGRQWRLDIEGHPAVVSALGLPQPLYVASSVAGLVVLLAALLYAFSNAIERKRSSSEHRARLAAIVESSHDAILGVSLDGRVTEWNRAAVEMFGFRAEEAIGRALVELIVPFERIQEDDQILKRVAAGENVAAIETIRRHRNGSPLYVEISASPIRNGGGAVVGVASTLRDIAESKEAEAEILQLNVTLEQQVEERTAEIQAYSALQRAILTNAGYAIVAAEPDGTITLFNPAAEAILGYTSKEVVGIATPALFHDPIEMAERAHALQVELGRRIAPGFEVFTAKARDAPDVNEWTYITKSGGRIPVLLNVSALRTSDGELLGYLGIAVDLRERKRREAALEINERKLRGLFELSPLGIVLTDEQGRFVEFNESFRLLTGYPEQELRDLDYWKLTPTEYAPQERSLLRTVERTGRYGPYEKHYMRKDGSRVPVRLNGVMLRIGGRPCIWSIVEDITAQRTSEAAMVDAVAAAEAASKAKSDFLANMSHEIRTPMNAILGMLQLMQKTRLDARQQDYAAKIQTAAKALLDILNDILDFSKIEAGHQTLEAHEFELEQVLRDISVILSANIGDKDIELVFDIDEYVPRCVIGDSLRLQQVLINLMGNAVKFTAFGEVVLAVRAVDLKKERISLEFEVRDTGIGIAKDKLADIFEGFSQAEASTTRRFGGTGLGLAISQRLVRLMGGELGVESERGRGSRFFFTITLDLPGAAGADQDHAMPPERLRDLRALVVDDNDSARSAILAMVRSVGWKADEASGGEAALERVKQADASGKPYQVIFLDWRMPGLDGWETGSRIRQLHGDSDSEPPMIVMVTAHGREMLAERLERERSMLDGFLIKPVTVAMLIDAVADAHAGQGDPASPPVPHDPSENRLAGMSILVVEDNVTNQQLVTELLRSEGARVAVAGGGAKALQMLAGEEGKYDAVLMDIQMPDMDGYTATRRIRSNLGFKKLPIIAMTANVLASDREACLVAGMNDHIGKPFDLDTLVERLLHWTGRPPAPGKPARVLEHGPAEPAGAISVLDWQSALARFGGKKQAYVEILHGFPDAAAELVGQLEHSLRAKQRDDAARQLHTLKGIAGTVGATRLAQLAKSLEAAIRSAQSSWEGAMWLDALRAWADEATASSKAVSRMLSSDEPAVAVTTESVSRAALEQLRVLLAANNLRALEEFRSLEAGLARHYPAEHQQLQGALERLDFATAAGVLLQLNARQE
ncbi:MAG TPA: PAS domain S-box protein [Lysobacter sp.]